MSKFYTYLMILLIGLFLFILIIDLIKNKNIKQFIIQSIILILVILFLKITIGFPRPIIGFGDVSPLVNIGIMFVCTILGIAAHYIYYLENEFNWFNFMKPLIITPIVLLPLMGSVKGGGELETMQVVSFGFLAFQNGFFWNEVLKRAGTKI